jgi:hypothetical protein
VTISGTITVKFYLTSIGTPGDQCTGGRQWAGNHSESRGSGKQTQLQDRAGSAICHHMSDNSQLLLQTNLLARLGACYTKGCCIDSEHPLVHY